MSTAQVSVRGAVPYPDRGFRRDVGFGALLFLSLGSIIGSGWLEGSATTITSAGGASILSWVLASVVIILLALVHAELGAAYPLAGGTARWPRLAFGSLGGFTAGWVSWLAAVMVAPIEVEASLSYLSYKWHGLVNNTGALTRTGFGVAAALMLLFTVINVLGVRWWARSNQWVVLVKIAVPLLTLLALITVSFRWSNFTTGGSFAPHGVSGVLVAVPWGNAAKLRRVFAGQVGFMGVGHRGCRPAVAPLAQALPGALETRLASGCQPGAASPLLGAWTPTLSWVNA